MKIIFLILIFTLFCGPVGYVAEVIGHSYQNEGWATFYTTESCKREGTSGKITASGRSYCEGALHCALPFYPPSVHGRRQWGQKYRITNLQTQKQIIVQHWDFGPGKRAQAKNVVIDLTPAAFLALGGKLKDGKIKVKIEKIK